MTKLHVFILQTQCKFARFLRNEEGASGIEYALLAAMVAVALAVVVPDVKLEVETIMDSILQGLKGEAPAAG
ncbi:hypothetical protein A8C75_20095 [Marinobacterium aestuarii]|uniref:Pilus assembly protein n=1 Tax=Marinobacterium aestuarii TaxID=1821621 RepID=A0A1A9F2L0_9GAMM|nr:Flp family type IVb pilin [Marinobacterium aestuarii]ANG64544.1 hypothetical protein A8C75_20095 [Marinobacterium aestuarii]